MRKNTLFLLCTFLTCAWGGFGLSAQTLRLMTYNIRLDVASDGPNAWEHRCFFMVSQINFYEPDVFGIQEGLPHQVAFLEKNLPGYKYEGIGREGLGKGESSAIFYNHARFSVVQSHTFWLSPTPDSISMGWDAACLRVCTAVLLKEKKTKKQYWVFNTHLDHMGEMARLKGMELILNKIKALNTEHLPLVLMGDLNATPESAVVASITAVLDDTRAKIGADAMGPEETFNGFKFGAPEKRIDYIFVSRSPGMAVRKYGVLTDSRNQRYPSDHFPVFAEIMLEKH